LQSIQTLIIGGGQGGLSVSYYLSQERREHVVLEAAAQPAHAWRNDRWDSFTLVTPNWTFRLPGAPYDGGDPHGYLPRAEIVSRFESYIERYRLPVQFSVRVRAVMPVEQGYQVETDHGSWQAQNVVIATGLFQAPKKPAFAANLPADILQLHSGHYRNPSALPGGAVLVVGSGQSGCQIAEELYQAGRKVYLCVGTAGRVPRRYRGKDIVEWLDLTGFLGRTPDKLPSPRARFAGNPQATGKDGGHTLNLHQFYRDGVILLGRIRGAQDGQILLAPDLKANLAKVDEFEVNIIKIIDELIVKAGMEAPGETLPVLRDGYDAPEILELDLEKAGVSTIIWTLGYTFDFSLVKLPVVDEFGFPVTERGVTRYPGLFFAGLPWLDTQATGILLGVGEQAGHIAAHISGK